MTNLPLPRPLPLSPLETTQVDKQLFLPGIDEFMRAMPNHIARSSLFAPVAPGRKKTHNETVLVSRSDAVITFSGVQLDEAQADVWMQAIHEASKHELGKPVVINSAAFLRAIGRAKSGDSYKWLHRAFKDLAKGLLIIETFKAGKLKHSIGKTRMLRMIDEFSYDEITEEYSFSVDPRWSALYANREFALIDWEKRLSLGRGQDMAKAMQRLLATSSDERQAFNLDWLKKKLEYTGRMRDFRAAIARAMEELLRVELITKWEIGKNIKGNDKLTVLVV